MRKYKQPFPYTLLIKSLLVLLMIFGLTRHVGYTLTESVHFRTYFHYPHTELKLGRYYAFAHNDHKYKGMAIKKLVCLPGQVVSRVENALFCNGNFIVNVEHVIDSYNNPLPYYEGETLVNKAFFIGDDPRSYDSRYFGGVPVTLIRRAVVPII